MQYVKSLLKEWVPPLAIAIVLVVLIQTFIVQPVKVPSGSMIPNIQINDRLIVNKMRWLFEFRRGDIVVFNHAAEGTNEVRYVKRLIGLPGDTLEVTSGTLYRNGEAVDEPYLNEPMRYDMEPLQVPEGHYFFLGDNRNSSYDAHLWPERFVEERDLVGKVFFRFFPFTSIGTM